MTTTVFYILCAIVLIAVRGIDVSKQTMSSEGRMRLALDITSYPLHSDSIQTDSAFRETESCDSALKSKQTTVLCPVMAAAD